MTNTATLAKLTSLRKDIESLVAEYNVALKAGDMKQTTATEALIKEAEKTYAGLSMNNFFEQVSDRNDYNRTLTQAITALCYQVLSHKMVKEDGVTTRMELIERSKTVDLEKLCKFNDFSTSWVYTLEKFNLLMTLRTAIELGLPKAALRAINDSFAMRKLSEQVELGKTPTSNTQICKQLQSVVDAILFMANDKETNTIKVNSHDVAYLLMCYTKRGRSALKVVCSKHSFVENLVTEILHRVITGKTYDVDYRMKKQ